VPEPSPARVCALRVIRRVFDEGAFADRAFRAEADRAGLDARDRAFAQQLAYGTVQMRALLDHVLDRISSRPHDALDPPLRDALRLGLFQLLCLDGVPQHAAVAETVELAKSAAGGGHKLANAVMRRATREGRSIVDALDPSDPAGAALLYSHPLWLTRMWWRALGPDEARALLARDNEPAESAVRANTLRTTRAKLADELGVPSHPADDIPEALVLEARLDLHGSRLFATGALMPQSRGSMLVGRVAAPEPGERVLDLCAAPGAKTTHLAALMEDRGEVVAVESHERRAEALATNAARLGASCVRVVQADAAEPLEHEGFHTVLLDPPCSDLGTLQARPDVRWRKDPSTLDRLAREQAELLESAAAQVRPGGTLIYSCCTISPEENEDRMRSFLESHQPFSADELGREWPRYASAADRRFLQVLPHRHGTDGFFIARLRKAER
jgi:16S rRNA (cytosine967-C5)-methyltransferase